ncbi:putative cyclomaltodextrinase [Clostridia bacterium]|nr:putative cyclomaltodextrinase [Clostridia bacterium]
MSIINAFHEPDSKYCFAVDEKTVVLRLRTGRGEAIGVHVLYGSKYDFAKKRFEAALSKAFTDALYDWWTVKLTLEDCRLVYVFAIESGGRSRYFSEDGVTDTYNFDRNYLNAFQLPYINAIDVHRPVKWMETAVFYQIFIDRFLRGDTEKNDGYIDLNWGEKPTYKSFAGGDLEGIRQKLDYLSELGVNALYLTPIFKSKSNHKYDITDYFNVDPQFGTNDAFKRLVADAHAKHIRVVLDAVFNHCSEDCGQFRDALKYGEKSRFYGWFLFHDDGTYECFASCEYMPKLNTSNPEVRDFLLKIAAHWIEEYDIDGWRLDVSDEVSHDFWRSFRKTVKAIKPDCVIIGENWHDAYPFLRGDQFDCIMNYAFTKACMDFFADKTIGAQGFAERLSALLMRNTDTVNAMMLNLLDSHDTHRFLTLLKGDVKALRAAIAVMFTFVGAPSVYYGTEIDMTGGYDPDCRRCFNWDKALSEAGELIRELAKLKPRGGIKLSSEGDTFVLERENVTLSIDGRFGICLKT